MAELPSSSVAVAASHPWPPLAPEGAPPGEPAGLDQQQYGHNGAAGASGEQRGVTAAAYTEEGIEALPAMLLADGEEQYVMRDAVPLAPLDFERIKAALHEGATKVCR